MMMKTSPFYEASRGVSRLPMPFGLGAAPMGSLRLLRRSSAGRRLENGGPPCRGLAPGNRGLAVARMDCWKAKKDYLFWGPITAITLADTDGNPATALDAAWTPLLGTPSHPDYPSGHSSGSGAAAAVLAHFFGENT